MRTGQHRTLKNPQRARIPLCSLVELPDGATRGFYLPLPEGELALFLVRRKGQVHAYHNACPHLGSPLEIRDHRFLSRDRRHILCSTHGALFEIDGGLCIDGPCHGRRLAALEVEITADGTIALRL